MNENRLYLFRMAESEAACILVRLYRPALASFKMTSRMEILPKTAQNNDQPIDGSSPPAVAA